MSRVLALATAVVIAAVAACNKRSERAPDKGTESPPPPQLLEAEVFAENVMMPVGLAADDEHVYWGDGGSLMRAPVAGGASEKLCSVDAVRIGSIALAKDRVFFGAMGGGLFRHAKGSSKCKRIATGANPTSLRAVGDRVWYWAGSPRWVKADAEGDAPAPTMMMAGYTGSLVADATLLFWHDGRTIYRRAIDDPDTETQIAHTGHLFFSMVDDDTHVYWNDDLVDGILRAPKSGGPLEYVAQQGGIGARLAIDDSYVYVVEADGSVSAVRNSDGASAFIATSIDSSLGKDSVSIAVGGGHLFVAANRMDLTGKEPVPLGRVGRISLADIGQLAFSPRPPAVVLSTVYFSPGKDRPQDINNATHFARWSDHRLTEAVGAGKLRLVLATAPTPDEASARKRATLVADAITVEVGAKAAIAVELRDGASSNVTVEIPRDAYAAVWAP